MLKVYVPFSLATKGPMIEQDSRSPSGIEIIADHVMLSYLLLCWLAACNLKHLPPPLGGAARKWRCFPNTLWHRSQALSASAKVSHKRVFTLVR